MLIKFLKFQLYERGNQVISDGKFLLNNSTPSSHLLPSNICQPASAHSIYSTRGNLVDLTEHRQFDHFANNLFGTSNSSLIVNHCPPFHPSAPVTTNSHQMVPMLNRPSTSNQYVCKTIDQHTVPSQKHFNVHPRSQNLFSTPPSLISPDELKKRINQLKLVDHSKNFGANESFDAEIPRTHNQSSSTSGSLDFVSTTLLKSDDSDTGYITTTEYQQNVSNSEKNIQNERRNL